MALLSTARGTSIATENVFESRFMFVDELNRMGADIRTEGHHAVIRGVERLSSAPVRALDIRAGAAMVIAALAADGTTEVLDLHHVDRGYEDIEGRLAALGDVMAVPQFRQLARMGGVGLMTTAVPGPDQIQSGYFTIGGGAKVRSDDRADAARMSNALTLAGIRVCVASSPPDPMSRLRG